MTDPHTCTPASAESMAGRVVVLCSRRHVVDSLLPTDWPGSRQETQIGELAARREAALRIAEREVVRHLQRYTSEERANRAASHRMGPRQRHAVGEHFYTHPAIPDRAFPSRGAAARAAVDTGKEV